MGQLEGQLDNAAQKPVLGAVAHNYCRLLAPADWTAAQRAALEETARVASLRLPRIIETKPANSHDNFFHETPRAHLRL